MKQRADCAIEIRWYLSYEVLFFEYADLGLQQDYLVWENLILLRADSPNEAYSKAIGHGKLSESEMRINEKPGYCKFKGIRKLVPIYEEIEDGCEIEWRESELTQAQLDDLIPVKSELQAFLPLTDV